MFWKTLMFGQTSAAIGATAAASVTQSITVVEGLQQCHAEVAPFKAVLTDGTRQTFDVFAVSSRTASAKALRGGGLSGAAPPLMRLQRALS